ncbi:MAG: hypothetical protein LBT04_06965 [Prevotellaceae bacterium]|jgi:hypothetical protein|nr:hypothetical protein [Prevotellaceae bacterium]
MEVNKIYKSLSIIGTEKNTGKTETLNWVLSQLKNSDRTVAVTSIGVDGEGTDAVSQTSKPEITVYEGMIFVTTENYFKQKQFSAEVLDVANGTSILGRLITAKAKNEGKILLSGATDTYTLRKIIEKNTAFGADLTVVDGALFRRSLASPAVTDAVILATGAAFSANMEVLVRKTKFVCKLIALPKVNESLSKLLTPIETGIWCIENNALHNLDVKSGLNISTLSAEDIEKIKRSKTVFVAGIVSDKLVDFLYKKNILKGILLITKDFTNIFLSQEKFNLLRALGVIVQVLQKTNLIAVTVNPTSPQGYVLDSDILTSRLKEDISVPVFDVRNGVTSEPVILL